MLDFDDRDLFGDFIQDAAASPHLKAADAPPLADLNVVLADNTADVDDFIFEGINITQTAARSWATAELPDFGIDLPDLWTPGSSMQPESPIATPKDDDPLPGLDTKATGSPQPAEEGIDPRALCASNIVLVEAPGETRPGTPEYSSVSLQQAAGVPHPAGPAMTTSPLVSGPGEFDALDSFFESIAAPPAPIGPPQPIPSAEELNEMMTTMFGQPVMEMPQAARPMPPNVPMMPPMSSMPPMPFAAPAYAANFYPAAYGFPPPFVTPQQMFWMAQAGMLAHPQQKPPECGPSRRKPARARPAPYQVDQHAQQGSHAGLYDGWRHPKPGVKQLPRLDDGEPENKKRKCAPKNPPRIGNMAHWPPGMPLPGVAPPAAQA